MSVKRPAILFLSSFILGIIIAYSKVPIIFKLSLIAIAIFLYARLLINKKLVFRTILFIIIFALLGFLRFRIIEEKYDEYDRKIESIGYGNKTMTGVVDVIGKSTNSNYYVLKNCEVDGIKLGNCRCYFNDEINPYAKIGNFVKIDCGLMVIDAPANEGEFNQKNYYRSNDINFIAFGNNFLITNDKVDILRQKIYEIKVLIKNQISEIFIYKDAGLFSAMVTGDKSTIDKEQKRLFSDNGIAHILAISGLHLSILGLAIFELLRKKLSVNISAGIVSIFILLYGIFIDAGATSLRAIIMLYIRFLSLAIGRTYDSRNTLYIICFIFLMINPYLLFNAGFQFSYVAIFALNQNVVINKFKWIKEKNENSDYCENSTNSLLLLTKIKVPAAVVLTLFLLPITIFHYYTYPLYSILLNLIVIPLMSFVLGFGLIGLLVSFASIQLGKIIVFVVHIIFLIYEKLCYFIEKLPFHILWLGKPAFYELLYYYIALFLIIYILKEQKIINLLIAKFPKNLKLKNNKNIIQKIEFHNDVLQKLIDNENTDDEENLKTFNILNNSKNFIKLLICLVALVVSVAVIGIRHHSDLRMTFVSIGQGDGILIEAGNTIMTVDGGSSSNNSAGQYILTPHIKSRGIDHIDYMFLTHSDSDHTNAMLYMLENETEIEFNNLVLPINATGDKGFDKIKQAARDKKMNIIFAREGDLIDIKEGLQIRVLSPDIETVKNNIKSNGKERLDKNELSLTFRLDYNNHSVLFTGDIGKQTMKRLLNDEYANEKLDVDVLKVPHHGSKNSNILEFFEETSPRYAVISYGRNSYGHPNIETVNSLLRVGATVLKTKETGQVDIYFDKNEIYYNRYCK